MLDRFLSNRYQQIRALLTVKANTDRAACMATGLLSSIRDTSTNEKLASKASRERRVQTYQLIKQLQIGGWKIGQIARRLDINPNTVRKYFYADNFPERNKRSARGSILNPYLSYLELPYQEGCQNAMQLWREIKEQGYPGTHRQVSKWMNKRCQKEQTSEGCMDHETIEHTCSPIVPPPTAIDTLPSARQWT